MQFDRDLVETAQDLKVHLDVREDSKVLRLERDVYGVLCARKVLALGWQSVEMGHFGEIEVQRQILILILDGKVIVSAVILRAFTERYILATDLDIGVASSCHHLNLQVIELFLIGAWYSYRELNESHRGILLWLYHILLFTGATKGSLLSSRLGTLSMIREAANFIVLLCSAYKSNG